MACIFLTSDADSVGKRHFPAAVDNFNSITTLDEFNILAKFQKDGYDEKSYFFIMLFGVPGNQSVDLHRFFQYNGECNHQCDRGTLKMMIVHLFSGCTMPSIELVECCARIG